MQVTLPLSKDTIERIGREARTENAILGCLNLNGKNVRGGCIEITNHIIEKIYTETTATTNQLTQVHLPMSGNEIHFAVGIDNTITHNDVYTGEDGFTIVDGSIDQFCSEQYNAGQVEISVGSYDDLPSVAIVQPTDNRREAWYDGIDEEDYLGFPPQIATE